MDTPLFRHIHTDLAVKDLDASVKFYTECLGYEVIEDSVIEGPIISFLSENRATKGRLVLLTLNHGSGIELFSFEDAQGKPVLGPPGKKLDLSLSYLVADLKNCIGLLKQKGCEPVTPIFEIKLSLGTTHIVFFRDPDGHLIELAEVS